MEGIGKRTRADVPVQFTFPDMLPYPEDNTPPFEDWLYKNIASGEVLGNRLYLPVCWTSYYKRYNYGKNQAAINQLQYFLNTLDKTQKYWTVIQNDDGILNDISHLDCKVFSMSGKPVGSEQLPLVCQPHRFLFPNIKKDILCSFVGRITNPIRKNLINIWNGNDFYLKKDCYVSCHHHSLEEYCKILARSMFVLCLPGYGFNSFRVCESLQYGAFPTILQDVSHPPIFERQTPFSIYDYSGKILMEDINMWLNYMVVQKEKRPSLHLEGAKKAYENYYTFPSVKKYILNKLAEECN